MPIPRPGARSPASCCAQAVAPLRPLALRVSAHSRVLTALGGGIMRLRWTLTPATMLACGVLIGWLASSGFVPDSLQAQDKAAEKAQADPLPSWNDGAAKKAILGFVRDTTAQGGPRYVPPEQRVATFDQDGTLWAEQPMYTQAIYCL